MTRPCVTHHHACDCREAELEAVRARLEEARELLLTMTCDDSNGPCWCELQQDADEGHTDLCRDIRAFLEKQ